MSFLRNRYVMILTLVLVVQGGLYYGVASRRETVPYVAPLSLFPLTVGGFEEVRDIPLEQDVRDLLKADDILNRIYADPSGARQLLFFVAYFKTQRQGQSPHSPKNCLPGSGWEPLTTDRPQITVPNWPTPITINRYVVQKGDDESITLYWYQSHNRVIASEYLAKFWLVADALRYRRSDTSLVRVSVPVYGHDIDGATRLGVQFVQAVFPELLNRLPL